MRDKKIGKWCVFVLLVLLLIGRCILEDDDSKWIQFIGFMGVVISLGDLYGKAHDKYNEKDKFRVIKGIAIIVVVILMMIGAGMILNVINLANRGNDLLTILALLISLPNDLYCDWIGSYIND